MVNIFIIFGLGGLWCMSMGFFDGENVPDFVAKRDDLRYYFKGLAAPEVANETADGDGASVQSPRRFPDFEISFDYASERMTPSPAATLRIR